MKKEKLDLTSILMISIISALGIFSVTVLIGIMYYFVNLASSMQLAQEYSMIQYFIHVSFIVCTIILLAEALHTILYKAIKNRQFEKKENPKFVKFAYWFILVMISISIMLIFTQTIKNFNAMFLLMLLLILKITQVMVKYTFMAFKVEKEDKTLLYLVFSILVITTLIGEFFIIKQLIEPKFASSLNDVKEFYSVASTVEEKLNDGKLEEAKNYVEWASARTNNQSVIDYAKTIKKVTEKDNEEVQKVIKNITNNAKRNMEIFEVEISLEAITRNILVVLVNIALVSIFAFVWFGEVEYVASLKEKKAAAKKAATKKEPAKKVVAKKATKK